MEICSDVNHSCCDTAMDSMANDFRGINHITLNTVSASIKSKSLTICCVQGVLWKSGALRTLVNVQRKSYIRWGISTFKMKLNQHTLHQVHQGPRLTLWKHGGDALSVDNITIVTEVKHCLWKENRT